MPRSGPAEKYVQLVHRLAANGMKATAISREVERIARENDWKDAPQLRTVQRIYAEWRDLPDELRQQAAYLQWPEAMQKGLLPWEASAAALDLLRFRDVKGMGRPTIRLTRWFWQVRLAVPDLPIDAANELAAHLGMTEYLDDQGRLSGRDNWAAAEWLAAYHPWRGDEDRRAYDAARSRQDEPIPGYVEWPNKDDDAFLFGLEATGGTRLADQYKLALRAYAKLSPEQQELASRKMEKEKPSHRVTERSTEEQRSESHTKGESDNG